ncbi:MAG: SDR family oxidoreductase [Solirubrobacterales bacterium]|nr:SDR family oxidoreductase [Solirubrobacterales bacterium]
MSADLAVTGATGVVGGKVAQLLAERGIAQRLLVRSPDRAPYLEGAKPVRCEYGDLELSRAGLEGVTVLFMVSATESADRLEQHRTFVDAAVAAGVGHIVYTSFQGASPDAVFTLARDHYATEEHIRASGMNWTFLRDSFYIDFLPKMVGDDGVIRGPAGDGTVAAVTRADVARSAAAVLIDPEAHRDRTYTLTGPESLSLPDAARIIGDETGAEVSFHDETIEEAYESRKKWPAPDWQYDAWVSTYTSMKSGEVSETSPDVRALTGQEPESLRAFMRRSC